jgi:4-diphosphocytidyl-2-C-methyl-D-erythritol kinase
VIIVSPSAKINLFLRIVSRRSDGYHAIETVFQRIGLCDELTFEKMDRPGVDLEVRGLELDESGQRRNLIVRAYDALTEACEHPLGGVRVVLDKRIPIGGGLGGGSSDAAATLATLNRLLDAGQDEHSLHRIAARLGADVPFFLGAPAAIGRGIGEELEPLPHRAAFFCALAFPKYGVSTAEAYRRFDPSHPDTQGDLPTLIDALHQCDLDATLRALYNGMESLAFAIVPELGRLRETLESDIGRTVRMSGSGSTLFTLTLEGKDAAEITARWRDHYGLRTAVAPFLLD